MKRRRFIKLGAFASVVFISAASALTVAISAAPTAIDENHDSIEISTQATQYHTQTMERSVDTKATRTGVNVNGRRVLEGRVLIIDDITYVPMFKFADWLGVFTYTTKENGYVTEGSISGENLKISAIENNLYIMANGRYFYTAGRVREIDGEMYVPIEPLVKALNCHISKSTWGTYSVRSGDTRRLKSAAAVYRDDEVYWLARIISAEARGESMQGKIAVGNVVLNRVRSKQYPNTIYGVIFDKKFGVQFAPTSNGTIYNTPTAESIIAAKMCLEGYTLSNDILYFFNPRYASGTWVRENREYAFTIGNHVFYN